MDPYSALALRPHHHHVRRPGGFGGGPHMHIPSPYMGMGPMGGMSLGGMDPYSMMYGSSMGMDPFAGFGGMLGGAGMPRSRRHLYSDLFDGYGGGRGGSRYDYPYDMFEDLLNDDLFPADFDDIQDPLLLHLRMQRGGGRRGGRRGRYGRYGGGNGFFL